MKNLLITGFLSLCSTLAVPAVEPGEMAPSFTATNLKSEQVSLDDFAGKLVVLEWVNFDCPFVHKHYQSGNMPALQKKYTDEGVVWISINSSAEGKQGHLPDDKMLVRMKKEGSLASHFIMDTDGKIGRAYGAQVTPHMIVINKDGKVVYNGAIDSMATTRAADIKTAAPYVADALNALLAGNQVKNAKTKPYGCGVKY